MIEIMDVYNQACDLETKRQTGHTLLDLLLDKMSDEEIDQLIDVIENKSSSVSILVSF